MESWIREVNTAASIPDHVNLLKPLGILYDDVDRLQVSGLVYPVMRGVDVFALTE